MSTRRISRGRFLTYSAGAVASLALAGCGSDSGQQDGRTRVVLWSSYPDQLGETMQKLVDKFNESQKDITVEHQFQGTYEETAQKLATALRSNKVPDLVTLSEVTWNNFYYSDNLQAMDEYFGSGLVPSDYVKPFIKEGTREGSVWWTPFARSTPLFYYNKEMFSKVGLPDRGPDTWDELRQWGKELVKLDGTPKAHAFTTAANYSSWYFQGNVWQWEGNYSTEGLEKITINGPSSVEAGEFVRRFINEDKLGYVADDQVTDFVNGQAATTEGSTGSMGQLTDSASFEFGAAFLPEQKAFGCPTGGAGLSIMSAAPDENKRAAFEFIKFAARPENAIFWATNTGYMPVTNAAINSDKMQSYFKKNPNFKVAVDQLPKTQPQDLARTVVPNGGQIIGKGLERVMINNESAGDVFARVAQELKSGAKQVKDKMKK